MKLLLTQKIEILKSDAVIMFIMQVSKIFTDILIKFIFILFCSFLQCFFLKKFIIEEFLPFSKYSSILSKKYENAIIIDNVNEKYKELDEIIDQLEEHLKEK